MASAAQSSDRPDLDRWLGGRSFADVRADFDRDGYVIFEHVLDPDMVERVRAALEPYLEADVTGRNDFEGLRSNRVYAMLAKSPVFAELVTHPLALAFAEADLGESCLLSACLAINLQPGETVQPWHYDDNHLRVPRPRDPFGVSTFWAIDPMTEDNGATELLPGSHVWPENSIEGANSAADFANTDIRSVDDDPAPRADAIKAVMPSGSLMVTKGTLWHRGGANRSDAPRLIVTPQYCPGWARQLENMAMTMTPEQAAELPERARELVGYSIHPPFMGYVDGMHPARVLKSSQH
ncbi:phytanoyl-CoA dioxygenase family protein [Parasphingopyxis sp. CP4]|uniref:phytanoyl-CoA dioxygenase family protein n=1 Tax=Parasphingopyxis sp. CP4 TaxID=2724527 RepID=UPI0015A17ED8|nr:phytanoyl-CoA dioxygenase family protein [Parasphingopyxis sp. CP4]QLC22907.1 phytanoyl-CoA dioxygenase family protein [Parasphingopyxis sp. CP4]